MCFLIIFSLEFDMPNLQTSGPVCSANASFNTILLSSLLSKLAMANPQAAFWKEIQSPLLQSCKIFFFFFFCMQCLTAKQNGQIKNYINLSTNQAIVCKTIHLSIIPASLNKSKRKTNSQDLMKFMPLVVKKKHARVAGNAYACISPSKNDCIGS